mmetsp:Transcript_33202/g.77359  ORF Transcript_33202/g.77359 Transcript_33202/m.77359 type:complete len:245 (-) Transcript_33202:843-1577(-)
MRVYFLHARRLPLQIKVQATRPALADQLVDAALGVSSIQQGLSELHVALERCILLGTPTAAPTAVLRDKDAVPNRVRMLKHHLLRPFGSLGTRKPVQLLNSRLLHHDGRGGSSPRTRSGPCRGCRMPLHHHGVIARGICSTCGRRSRQSGTRCLHRDVTPQTAASLQRILQTAYKARRCATSLSKTPKEECPTTPLWVAGARAAKPSSPSIASRQDGGASSARSTAVPASVPAARIHCAKGCNG